MSDLASEYEDWYKGSKGWLVFDTELVRRFEESKKQGRD